MCRCLQERNIWTKVGWNGTCKRGLKPTIVSRWEEMMTLSSWSVISLLGFLGSSSLCLICFLLFFLLLSHSLLSLLYFIQQLLLEWPVVRNSRIFLGFVYKEMLEKVFWSKRRGKIFNLLLW